MNNRVAGALVAVVVALGLIPGAAQGVLNGTEGGGTPEAVYRAAGPQGGAGTAFTVRYPRCMLTADHIVPTTIFRGSDSQNIKANMRRPTADDPLSSWNDLRLLWTTNYQGGSRLDLTGAQPLEVRPDATTAIAVPAINPTAGGAIPWANYQTPVSLLVEGYGMASAMTASAGVLRFGEFTAIGRANGLASGRDQGSVWVLASGQGYGICDGDSGGPAFNSLGQVIGVVHGTGNPACAEAPTDASGSYLTNGHQGFVTGFSAEAAGDAMSTWDWVDMGIELMCGKQLRVETVGEGSVSGDRSGTAVRSFQDRPVIDADIDCAWDDSSDDCIDVLHHEQSMDLTAEADAGWDFSEWWSGDQGDCPCDGSDDPTCPVDVDDLGEYTDAVSFDHGSCVAVFICTEDADGDGVPACEDCDDQDPLIGAEGVEVCDGLDNDCDGAIDEDGDVLMHRDADDDGFGDPDVVGYFCDAEQGWIEDDQDCDDADPDVHPDAFELCNGRDDDCDEDIDEDGTVDGSDYYLDADEDGYGGFESMGQACSPPQGFVSDNTDCDDSSAEIHPDGAEVCDGMDNNCDWMFDEGCGDPWEDHGWDPTMDTSTNDDDVEAVGDEWGTPVGEDWYEEAMQTPYGTADSADTYSSDGDSDGGW